MSVGVGRIRTQNVERRQGFTGPDHRSRRFSASKSEESFQEEEAATQGEKVSAFSVNLAGRLTSDFYEEKELETKEQMYPQKRGFHGA